MKLKKFFVKYEQVSKDLISVDFGYNFCDTVINCHQLSGRKVLYGYVIVKYLVTPADEGFH